MFLQLGLSAFVRALQDLGGNLCEASYTKGELAQGTKARNEHSFLQGSSHTVSIDWFSACIAREESLIGFPGLNTVMGEQICEIADIETVTVTWFPRIKGM